MEMPILMSEFSMAMALVLKPATEAAKATPATEKASFLNFMSSLPSLINSESVQVRFSGLQVLQPALDLQANRAVKLPAAALQLMLNKLHGMKKCRDHKKRFCRLNTVEINDP